MQNEWKSKSKNYKKRSKKWYFSLHIIPWVLVKKSVKKHVKRSKKTPFLNSKKMIKNQQFFGSKKSNFIHLKKCQKNPKNQQFFDQIYNIFSTQIFTSILDEIFPVFSLLFTCFFRSNFDCFSHFFLTFFPMWDGWKSTIFVYV